MALPAFSIIIPTIGRFPALQHCLEAISQISYPQEQLEIIVVFDGCARCDLSEIGPLAIRTFRQPRSGPAAARNYGAREARGEYLAFIDDDCLPTSHWLLELMSVLNHHPQAMTGGKTINALPDNPYASASQLLVDYLYTQFNQPDEARFFTSNNMALRRDLFLAIGGFDETFTLAAGEDRELCDRWLNKGGELFYVPQAVVHHAPVLTLSAFWKQHINYGRGAFRYRKKGDAPKKRRRYREGFLFYVNLLRFPLKQAGSLWAVRLFLLFLMMQTATTIGFLRERFSMSK